jgi:PBP1b-binding outer membrane lipoprotein LpoB
MKTLFSLLILILLTSSCANKIKCEAKPDPKVTVDADINIEVTPGARVACEF